VTDPTARERGTIRELADDVLLLTVGEETREEDLDAFFAALRPLLEARAPARVLVDASRFSGTPLRLRWQMWRRMRAERAWIGRTAVFGLSDRLETLLWVLPVPGRRRNVRTFLWRHEAEEWLADPSLP